MGRLFSYVFKYALIVSALRYGIQLHAFCAMSTHLHDVDMAGRAPKTRIVHGPRLGKGECAVIVDGFEAIFSRHTTIRL